MFDSDAPAATQSMVVALVCAGALLGGLVVHELAHGVAATAVGQKVTRIAIGSSGPALRFHVYGCFVEIRLVMLGGKTDTAWRTPALPWEVLIVTAAGPLANAALGAALVLLGRPEPGNPLLSPATSPWFYAGVINLGVLIENMVPRRRRLGGQRLPTDGFTLLATLRGCIGWRRWSAAWIQRQSQSTGLLLLAADALAERAGAERIDACHLAAALAWATPPSLVPIAGAGFSLVPDTGSVPRSGLPAPARPPTKHAQLLTRLAIRAARRQRAFLSHIEIATVLLDRGLLDEELARRGIGHDVACEAVREVTQYVHESAARCIDIARRGCPAPLDHWLAEQADFTVHLTDRDRAVAMNNAAYVMLAYTPDERGALALDLARAAVRLWPEHRGFRGTLALALIAAGSVDEGLDMSQAVLQEPELSDADRAAQLAISALGFLLRGERDRAVPLIDEAVRLHHTDPVVARARALLEPGGGAAARAPGVAGRFCQHRTKR